MTFSSRNIFSVSTIKEIFFYDSFHINIVECSSLQWKKTSFERKFRCQPSVSSFPLLSYQTRLMRKYLMFIITRFNLTFIVAFFEGFLDLEGAGGRGVRGTHHSATLVNLFRFIDCQKEKKTKPISVGNKTNIGFWTWLLFNPQYCRSYENLSLKNSEFRGNQPKGIRTT